MRSTPSMRVLLLFVLPSARGMSHKRVNLTAYEGAPFSRARATRAPRGDLSHASRAPRPRARARADCIAPREPQAMPRCAANHTVYHTQKFETGTDGANGNCAHCVCDSYYRNDARYDALSLDEHDTWGRCCAGWNGTECDVCHSVDACAPRVDVDAASGNRTARRARNCTRGSLLPTAEEARHGKRFSCRCGGGEDKLSEQECAAQPDTSLEMTMYGMGTAQAPATLEIRECEFAARAPRALSLLGEAGRE